MADEKKVGGQTIVKEFAKSSIQEIKSLSKEVHELGINQLKQSSEWERRLNDAIRELEKRFE